MKATGRTTIRKGGLVTEGAKFIKQWRFEASENSALAGLERAYFAALETVDKVEERTRTTKASGKFTADGVVQDVRGYITSDLVGPLRRARNVVDRAKTDVAERRAKLKLDGPDKTDIAGAVRRQEIRQRLRDMKPDDQAMYFAKMGNRVADEIAQAIVEMPPEFSGVPASRHTLLVDRAMTSKFGDEIASLEQMEEAIDIAESTIDASRFELMVEAKMFNRQQFDEMVAPMEAKFTAPWLRRDGAGNVNVVDLERKVTRRATPEEADSGVFYNNYDDYLEGRAA
jgi:hypothetical protein